MLFCFIILDKTEAQKRENKSNLSIHIFIDENNTFQRAIAECSFIEKSNIHKKQNIHAVSTFSQKATNVKMDSLNADDKHIECLYGNSLQQKKINTYENEHAIILNSCFPNQCFRNPKMLQSISLYNNNINRNTCSDVKSSKTVYELKSEHTVQCMKTDALYHEFFKGAEPEYMNSESRKQFELNQKSIRKRIPLCRKPIQYFERSDKGGFGCQCNACNNVLKSDITHGRYDSKQMMKDIKSIQLNDCKEIEDKVELYRKFKQIIDKHRERKISSSGNQQFITYNNAASTSDNIQNENNDNANNIAHHIKDYKKTVDINHKNCFKCNTSTISVAVQTNDVNLISENIEVILPQNMTQMEISKSVISNSLLKQSSFIKSQILPSTEVLINNSDFISDTIPVTSQIHCNTKLIVQTLENNEVVYKAESKSRYVDNQTNSVKPTPSRTRRQSTSRFNRSQAKGMPICFPIQNTNATLKTSSVFFITSKENSTIIHYVIENLLFEISENLITKLDKDQFQNHLDPLLRASTDYNFHNKVLNNNFSQSKILDELITKYVEEFNTLRTENLFKLIIILLDSVCEMLYNNSFNDSDYHSVRQSSL